MTFENHETPDEAHRARRPKKPRGKFVIEWKRAFATNWGGWLSEWKPYKRYQTEEQRSTALAALQRKDSGIFLYRNAEAASDSPTSP